MTPERLRAVVLSWARWYTRGLPAAVADRRRQELQADVYDHIEHQRAAGARDSQIAHEITSRMIRGLLADASWRRGQLRLLGTPERSMWRRGSLVRSAARLTLGVAVVLALPAIATATGNADWGLGDFILAGLLLALIGVTLEFAVRSAGNVVGAAAIAALGVAAAVAGESDDAPGLTLMGVLLAASAGLLVVRIVSRAR